MEINSFYMLKLWNKNYFFKYLNNYINVKNYVK